MEPVNMIQMGAICGKEKEAACISESKGFAELLEQNLLLKHEPSVKEGVMPEDTNELTSFEDTEDKELIPQGLFAEVQSAIVQMIYAMPPQKEPAQSIEKNLSGEEELCILPGTGKLPRREGTVNPQVELDNIWIAENEVSAVIQTDMPSKENEIIDIGGPKKNEVQYAVSVAKEGIASEVYEVSKEYESSEETAVENTVDGNLTSKDKAITEENAIPKEKVITEENAIQEEDTIPEEDAMPKERHSEKIKVKDTRAESIIKGMAEPKHIVGINADIKQVAGIKHVAAGAQEEGIKVSTTQETLVADVGKGLAGNLPKVDGTLTVELEPASLGKLTIHVVYESGEATVSILASNPKALELLSEQAGELAGILEEKTGQRTFIYTPQSAEPYESGENKKEHRRDKRQNHSNGKKQADTFTQQLRLGLV